MRHAIIAAALLLAACGDSTQPSQVSADNASPAEPASIEASQQQNVDNELIDQANGTRVLRLEGNDSATFVGGELVEVNRAP